MLGDENDDVVGVDAIDIDACDETHKNGCRYMVALINNGKISVGLK